MTVAAKIDSLQKKIEELKKKKSELERKRSENFAKLLQKCGLDDWDEKVLAGALLSLDESLDANKEVWQKAGEKFLGKKSRSKTRSPSEQDSKKTA